MTDSGETPALVAQYPISAIPFAAGESSPSNGHADTSSIPSMVVPDILQFANHGQSSSINTAIGPPQHQSTQAVSIISLQIPSPIERSCSVWAPGISNLKLPTGERGPDSTKNFYNNVSSFAPPKGPLLIQLNPEETSLMRYFIEDLAKWVSILG